MREAISIVALVALNVVTRIRQETNKAPAFPRYNPTISTAAIPEPVVFLAMISSMGEI